MARRSPLFVSIVSDAHLFARLTALMERHIVEIDVKEDIDSNFYMDTHFVQWGSDLGRHARSALLTSTAQSHAARRR
jgi:hypothetical protein